MVLPELVATATSAARTQEELEGLAVFGGNYVEGSAPWRAIALAVLSASEQFALDPRNIYSQLTWKGIISYSGPANEVSPHWVSDVENVRNHLMGETAPSLQGYWEWRLEQAESALAYERAKLAEERGE